MTEGSKPSLIVVDNTVLSNFATVEQKNLLLNLWPERIGTTQAVMDEFQFAVQKDLIPASDWDELLILALKKMNGIWPVVSLTAWGLENALVWPLLVNEWGHLPATMLTLAPSLPI